MAQRRRHGQGNQDDGRLKNNIDLLPAGLNDGRDGHGEGHDDDEDDQGRQGSISVGHSSSQRGDATGPRHVTDVTDSAAVTAKL